MIALPPVLVAVLGVVSALLYRATRWSDDAAHRRAGAEPRALAILRRWSVPAALLMGAGCLLAPGPAAAALAAPWLLIGGLAAGRGAARLLGRGLAPASELAIDGGSVLLAIGALWAWALCAGWSLLGYSPLWVALTAAHFHAAGFLLPVLAGTLARQSPSRAASLAIGVVLVSVPLTAIGIAWSRALEQIAALSVAAAAVTVGALALGEARRGIRGLPIACAGAALFLTMPLAAGYALAPHALPFRDPLASMVVWHGAVNALALAIAGAAAAIARPPPRDAPAGRPHSLLCSRGAVGADFFARRGLETAREAHGLVDALEELGHAGFDPARVAPAVRAFYERTDAHRLVVRPRWRTGFRTGARLWSRVARAMGQLQIPVAAERGDEPIGSRVVALDDRDGRPGARAWLRTFADGRAMYAAAYATHRLGATPYMNIAFPVPRGNLASILRMDPLPGDARGDAVVLTTRDQPGHPGDAGIWLVLRIGRRAAPLRLPMQETIRVWAAGMPGVPPDLATWAAAGATAVARHELWLLGVRYLVLDYAILVS
ncbi:MAG TPA: YndJ family transporter [Kofleriaceae bacterium]|nr:YndJ family transporter [Kofleriaceae bacterium]